MTRVLRRAGLLLAVVPALILTACVSAGGTTTTGLVGMRPGESRDRTTASDESDASKRATVRLELASGYFSRGQMTTALDQVKLALAADPNMVEAYNLRGLIYGSLGDDRLAEESFRRGLQIKAQDADTLQNFGWYLCQHKRYDEANVMFGRALAVPQYRDVSRTLLTQGVCQAFAGDTATAEKTLLRSYELDPSNPSTATNLSELLYRRGDFERARFYIGRVNAVTEVASPQTLWLAARIENKLGNTAAVQALGGQLRGRFPDSRESSAFDRGLFDE